MSLVNPCFSVDSCPTVSRACARSIGTEAKMKTNAVNSSSLFRCIGRVSVRASQLGGAPHNMIGTQQTAVKSKGLRDHSRIAVSYRRLYDDFKYFAVRATGHPMAFVPVPQGSARYRSSPILKPLVRFPFIGILQVLVLTLACVVY